MDSDLAHATDPSGFAGSVRAALADHPLMHHHEGGMSSERHVTHAGHDIVVRTTYEITVDGRPFSGHVFVSNDGDLRTHTLPNYTFPSAIDMIAAIIDRFPADFRADVPGGQHGGGHGGEHGHNHGHGG